MLIRMYEVIIVLIWSVMRYSILGSSGLSVSRACLGSMTWGIQNTQKDADEQINYAIEQGINFIDTAEMYPVPPNKETYGDTERCIGDWLSRNKAKRKDLVIASKIAGAGLPYIRKSGLITGDAITLSVDASLSRLQTDFIDMYQLHWPNRFSPHFGKHWPNYVKPSKTNVEQEKDRMRDILKGIKGVIDSGKIRYWGLSDDTPWGIHTYLNLCDELGIDRPVSIQNEFSLLHPKDWPYLIETCSFENVAYLPWSPLATGLLTGKYIGGARPNGSRFTLMQRNGLFRDTKQSELAVVEYCKLAEKYNISPSELALMWCDQVDGVTSTIIGATQMSQLSQNIDAFNHTLPKECLDEIHQILTQFPATF